MGRARGGCERRRWEASPLATHRVRSDRVSVRERLRQAERGNEGSGWHSATRGGGGSYRGIWAGSGPCHYWAMRPTVLHGPD
jgi:hypothetical protein